MKTRRFFFSGLFFCLMGGIFCFHFCLAQTVSLTPALLEIERNSGFSLTLNIESVSDLFGVSFDVDFDSSLVSFVSVNEGNFLSEGCQTVLMTDNSSAGKLIVSLTRLGASCGGVSGSGALMKLNFKSLDQLGINNFSFSNNSLCILENDSCNYLTGTWLPAGVTISHNEILSLRALGNYQYHLQANLASYSNIDTNDAYVIGWQGDWDNLIPMTAAGQIGWAEITLTSSGQRVQKFCITNSAKQEWFWIDSITHSLIVPSIWTDPAANPDDKAIAFWAEADSFQYLTGSLVEETLLLEALGNYQYHLQANLASYSNIDTNDAYVIGWQGDWDNLIPMTAAGQIGWAEITLTSSGQRVQKFCITNSAKQEWFWIDSITHSLIVPSIWTDPAANPDDKAIAFWAEADSFQYLTGSLVEETLPLEALGNYQYHLQANLASYSNIDTNDAYVIGWQGDWDNLIPMTAAGQIGWAEITLTSSGQRVQKFCITNSAKQEWFWIDSITHSLIVPSIWTDPAANPDDKAIAFWAEADSFQYLTGLLK